MKLISEVIRTNQSEVVVFLLYFYQRHHPLISTQIKLQISSVKLSSFFEWNPTDYTRSLLAHGCMQMARKHITVNLGGRWYAWAAPCLKYTRHKQYAESLIKMLIYRAVCGQTLHRVPLSYLLLFKQHHFW